MTETPITPPPPSTLADALRAELDSLDAAPRSVTLFSGEHVGSFAERHYYRFETPEHVSFRHLSRIGCSVGTLQPMNFDAEVVSLDNQFLTLAAPFDFGPVLPELSCSWDYRAGFQPVVDVLAKMEEHNLTYQRLLNPAGGDNLHAVSFEPRVIPDIPQDQQTAIGKILRNRVSFLWGPVRSGKTQLLAQLAATYIANHKSVLFITTMNEHVDDLLLRSMEIGTTLGIDVSSAACCLGLPATENVEKLGSVSFEKRIADLKNEKKRSFQERVNLLATIWNVRIKQILYEDQLSRITDFREQISEKNKHLERVKAELNPLKETVGKIQNASMMDRLKKGFGKEDLAQAQKQLAEKQVVIKQLQTQLTALTQESLRHEAQTPLSGEELQQYNLAIKRIEELGGLEKVQEAVNQYTAVDEEAEFASRSFVGTTIVHALSHQQVAKRTFDLVIVDDAEGLSIPLLATLTGLAKEKFVVCGDPYQLGPESVSNVPLAHAWLKQDIFLHVARTEHLQFMFEFSEKNAEWCLCLSSHFASTPKLSLFLGQVLFDNKINVFASPAAKGRIFFIDTSSLHSVAQQYLGRKKILPHNEIHTKKVLELVKHALMEPLRTATNVGVVVPFPGPTLYLKQQLRMHGLHNVEVGLPQSFRGHRKDALVFDTVAAGVDHTIRTIDDQKAGESRIVRLLNTVLSCVQEDVYILADMSHFQAIYPNRLLTKLLMLLKAQADPSVNFFQSAKEFDELDWDKREKILAYSGEGIAAAAAGRKPTAMVEDAELAVRMKLMAKREGVKIESQDKDEKEIYKAVLRVLGLRSDVNLLAQQVGGKALFRHSLSTELAVQQLPLTVCRSEKEFQSVMSRWNLLIFEMSGGHRADSALLKSAPETKVRGDINALKTFYSSSVESTLEEGKQKLAMAVSKIFQENLGKPQPANPQEWTKSYLYFLSKLESYLGWTVDQLRK